MTKDKRVYELTKTGMPYYKIAELENLGSFQEVKDARARYLMELLIEAGRLEAIEIRAEKARLLAEKQAKAKARYAQTRKDKRLAAKKKAEALARLHVKTKKVYYPSRVLRELRKEHSLANNSMVG